jgi:nucleoside-diphosphate-sugar epimerase
LPGRRFLITGGSGFIGINLARYLLSLGYGVSTLDLVDFEYPEREQVAAVKGDVRDPNSVLLAMRQVDVVINAAAALPLDQSVHILSTALDGTRNVLEAACKLGVERVIHVSSTAVYGIPDHYPLSENDIASGVGAYGRAKVGAEHICNEYRKRGLCVPILRPKTCVGPERLGLFALLFDWAHDGRNFPIVGSGKNCYQLLDVEDLSAAIVACATLDAGRVNDTFNVAAERFTTIREDFQSVLDCAGFGKRVVTLPAQPATLVLRVLARLGLSPIYDRLCRTIVLDSSVSIDRAERKLGYRPKFSNKEALARNYRWYVDHLAQFKRSSGISHRVPWNQGILRLAKLAF